MGNAEQAVYTWASEWKNRCLINDGSILTDDRLWTHANFGHLDKHYVQNLDLGEGSFYEKLEGQLASCPSEAIQLTAELFWLMFLFPDHSALKPETKLLQVRQIWGWSGEPFPETAPALEALQEGVGHPGTAFFTLRWKELVFLINAFRSFKGEPSDERRELLSSPWTMLSFLDGVDESTNRQLRHILGHLIFPDVIEPIATGSHKSTILRHFSDQLNIDPIDYSDPVALDRGLSQVREHLSETNDGQEMHFFYQEPIYSQWSAKEQPPRPDGKSSEAEEWYRDRFGNRRTWAISPGSGARFWEQWKSEEIVAIGWAEVGDLRALPEKEQIEQAHKDQYDIDNPMNNTLACYQFAHEMAVGDVVLAKKGTRQILGWGEITSDYDFKPDREQPHVRGVDWKQTGAWKVPEGRHITGKTLTDFTKYPDWLMMAFGLLEGGGPKPDPPDKYTVDMATDGLFMSSKDFREALDLFARKKNMILEGPPGVGKTFVARRLAFALLGVRDPQRVHMVQFHQSYAYEDFVQGWRPTSDGGFELRNGPFFKFCEQARADVDRPYVFIIDEINRANLSKVLGELMMLLEADKRGPDFAVSLAYAPDLEFYVPENVHVLGLMNTADRSLAIVDYALRRRFSFVQLDPAFTTEEFADHLHEYGAEPEIVARICERLTDLNRQIREDTQNLGHGFEIGHSYFCPQDGDEGLDEIWYERIIRTEIEPLLREYWVSGQAKVDSAVSALLS